MKKVVRSVSIVEILNADNMEKLEILEELLNEIYNAEEVIDGSYNPLEFEDELEEVNEYHEHTLRTLRNYMSIIRTRIGIENGE